MTKRKIHYRLYANNVTDETVGIAESGRFSRITADYLLVYTKTKMKDWPEITDDNVSILTNADRKWLFECNMELIAEEMSKTENNFGVDMQRTIDELEKALNRERELIKNNEPEQRA